MGQNHQIFNPVIIMDTVDVMDIFPGLQLSPQIFLHDFPMLSVETACHRICLQRQFWVSLHIQCGEMRGLMPSRVAKDIDLLANMAAQPRKPTLVAAEIPASNQRRGNLDFFPTGRTLYCLALKLSGIVTLFAAEMSVL